LELRSGIPGALFLVLLFRDGIAGSGVELGAIFEGYATETEIVARATRVGNWRPRGREKGPRASGGEASCDFFVLSASLFFLLSASLFLLGRLPLLFFLSSLFEEFLSVLWRLTTVGTTGFAFGS
jgi:hypothetical protein